MILEHQQRQEHRSYNDNLSKWFCSSFLGSKILTYVQDQLFRIVKLNEKLDVLVEMDPSMTFGKADSRKKPSPLCSTSPLHLRLNNAAERRTLIDQFRNNSSGASCFPAILGGGFRIEAYRPPNMPIPQRYRPLAKSSPGRIHTIMSSSVPRDMSKSPGREKTHGSNCPHQAHHKQRKLKSKSNSSGKVASKAHDNANYSNTDTDSKPRVKKKHNRKMYSRAKMSEMIAHKCHHNSGTPTTAISMMKSTPSKIPSNDSQAVLNTIGQCLDSLRKHRCLSHPRMNHCPFSHADKPFCIPSCGSNKLIEIRKPLLVASPITHIETKWRHRRATSDSPPTKIEASLPIIPDKIELSISDKTEKIPSEVKSEKADKSGSKKEDLKECPLNRKEPDNKSNLENQDHLSSENKEKDSPTDSLSSSTAESTPISSSPVEEQMNSAPLTDTGPSSTSPSSNLEQSEVEPAEKPEEDTAVESGVADKHSEPHISMSSVSRDKNIVFESKVSAASESTNKRRQAVRSQQINASKLPKPFTPTPKTKCASVHFTSEDLLKGIFPGGVQSQQHNRMALNAYDNKPKHFSHDDLQNCPLQQSRLSSPHSSAPSSRPASRHSGPHGSQPSSQFHSSKHAGDEPAGPPFPSNQQDQLLSHQKDSFSPDLAKKYLPGQQGTQYHQDEDPQDLSEQLLEQFLPEQEVQYVSDQDGVYISDQPEQFIGDGLNYESEQPNQYESDQYGDYPVHPLPGNIAQQQSDQIQNQSGQGHKETDQDTIQQILELSRQESPPVQDGHHLFQRAELLTSGNPLLLQGQSRLSARSKSARSKRRVSYGRDSCIIDNSSLPYRLSSRLAADAKSTSLDSVSQESAERFDDTSIQSTLSSISSDTSMSELVSRLTTLSTQTKNSFAGPDYERSNDPYGVELNNSREPKIRLPSPARQKPLLPMRQGSSAQTESNNYPGMNKFNLPQSSTKQSFPQFSGNINLANRSSQPGYSFSPFQFNRNPRSSAVHDPPQQNFAPQGNRQRRRFSPYSMQNNIHDRPQKDVSPRIHPVGEYSISKSNPDGFTIKFPNFLSTSEFVKNTKANDRNSPGRNETRAPNKVKVYDCGSIKLPTVSASQYMKYSELPTFSQATLSFDASSTQLSDNSKDNGYPSTSNEYDFTEATDFTRAQNNGQNGPTASKSKTWIPNSHCSTPMGNTSAQTSGTFPKISPGLFPGLPPGMHPGLMPGMSPVPGVPGSMYAGIMPMYSGMYPSIFMYPGMPPMQCQGMWHPGKGQPMASPPAATQSCMSTSAVMFPYFPYSMPMIPWNLQMGVTGHPTFPNMPIMTFDPCSCGVSPSMCTVPQPSPEVRNMRTPPAATPMPQTLSHKTRNCTIPEAPEPTSNDVSSSNGGGGGGGGGVGRMPLRFQSFLRNKDK